MLPKARSTVGLDCIQIFRAGYAVVNHGGEDFLTMCFATETSKHIQKVDHVMRTSWNKRRQMTAPR